MSYVGTIILINDSFVFPQYSQSVFVTWMTYVRFLQ